MIFVDPAKLTAKSRFDRRRAFRFGIRTAWPFTFGKASKNARASSTPKAAVILVPREHRYAACASFLHAGVPRLTKQVEDLGQGSCSGILPGQSLWSQQKEQQRRTHTHTHTQTHTHTHTRTHTHTTHTKTVSSNSGGQLNSFDLRTLFPRERNLCTAQQQGKSSVSKILKQGIVPSMILEKTLSSPFFKWLIGRSGASGRSPWIQSLAINAVTYVGLQMWRAEMWGGSFKLRARGINEFLH